MYDVVCMTHVCCMLCVYVCTNSATEARVLAEAARAAAAVKAVEEKAALLAQLSQMKIKELKRKARAMGADESVIEDLDDEDDVKAATIKLITGMMATEEGVPPE
jgi:hypothetical protein